MKRPVEQIEPDLCEIRSYAVPKLTLTFDSVDYVKLSEKWRSKRLKQQLPSLEELAAYIDTPLEPSEKVPIIQRWFDGLISPIYPDICTYDDVASLFLVSPDADPNMITFFHAVSTPPPSPGTECSFVYFWDLNIRSILERLLPMQRCYETGTSIHRPKIFALIMLCFIATYAFGVARRGKTNLPIPRVNYLTNLSVTFLSNDTLKHIPAKAVK